MTQRSGPDELPDVPAHDVTVHLIEAGKVDGGALDGAGRETTPILRSPLHPDGVTPPWMRAVLARLESAFPAFSFTISRGWGGFRFEAWRGPAPTGLYAVITDDPRELWHELETAQR